VNPVLRPDRWERAYRAASIFRERRSRTEHSRCLCEMRSNRFDRTGETLICPFRSGSAERILALEWPCSHCDCGRCDQPSTRDHRWLRAITKGQSSCSGSPKAATRAEFRTPTVRYGATSPASGITRWQSRSARLTARHTGTSLDIHHRCFNGMRAMGVNRGRKLSPVFTT